MKIGFISDLHLGFGKEREIYEDTFLIAEKILSELANKCEIIFIVGDLFDEKNPDNETILRAIKIFKNLRKKDEKIKFRINDQEFEENIPIIFAIHGNHDRRLKDEISSYRIFEELGFFHYIPYGKIIFEREKICIQALSNVPEKYAKKILYERLNPKPVENFFNILVLHQNIFPYVYSVTESSLKINDLPKNFDLIVNGHIHLRNVERIDNKTTLLILGSPIITQLREEEINEKRGYNIVEIFEDRNFKIYFEQIELPRKYYILDFSSENLTINRIEEKLREIIVKEKNKPVIKIRIFGEKEVEDRVIKNVLEKFEEKAIIRFENLTRGEKTIKSLEILEKIKERKSVDEIITSTILEKLKEKNFSNSFNFLDLIELFEDGDVDTLVEILTQTQKTLTNIKT
ncbi:MAG: DNA repair exonuclease [Candidatus Aenigmatarchaeota archaeon]